MEACPDTLTRSEEGRAGQGTYELAVSLGEEGGWDGGFGTCKKNPGHEMFIPINKLTYHYLHPAHSHKLNWIKHLADLTVKVSVNYVSPHRPARFSLPQFAGKEHLFFGSGFVTNITDGEMTCPIKNCSDLPGQHPVPGYITITTAAHVVCDDAEAERTTVEFFYDNPGDKSRVLTCRGVKVGTVNVEGDFCELLCVTHDRKLHDRIKRLSLDGVDINKMVDISVRDRIKRLPSTTFISALQRVRSIFDRFPSLYGVDINKMKVISVSVDFGNRCASSFLNALISYGVTRIFADRARNFWRGFGLTGTNVDIYRYGQETIIAVSGNYEQVRLNISGTARLFDDNLEIVSLQNLFREPLKPKRYSIKSNYSRLTDEARESRHFKKPKNNLMQTVQNEDSEGPYTLMNDTSHNMYQSPFNKEERDLIRELREQAADLNVVDKLVEKYQAKIKQIPGCETHSIIARLEMILQRAELRRTKFEKRLRITSDYNPPSLKGARFVGEFLLLDYHCTNDFKTQSDSPAAKSETRDNSLSMVFQTWTKFDESLRIHRNYNQPSFKETRLVGGSLALDYHSVTDLIPATKSEKHDNSLVVHISHPHGQSKMVSVGSLTECFTGNGYYCPLYTAPTCPGSSGGPTFVLPETDDSSQIYGMPHRSSHGNMLNEGSDWTMYPIG